MLFFFGGHCSCVALSIRLAFSVANDNVYRAVEFADYRYFRLWQLAAAKALARKVHEAHLVDAAASHVVADILGLSAAPFVTPTIASD